MEGINILDLEFENLLLKANGNQFQELFHRLMRQHSNDFMSIVPNGPKGDKGCDGYLSNQGTYFQLYGPINPSKKTTINTAKKKLLEDFNKLNSFIEENESFPRINEYIFVVNNKSESYITMDLAEQLEVLKSNVTNVVFSIYDVENIKGIFRGLTLNSQMVVLGKMNNAKSQKAKTLLDQLRTEDIERDVLNLREILQKSNYPIKLIRKTDFISPFESDIMSEIER